MPSTNHCAWRAYAKARCAGPLLLVQEGPKFIGRDLRVSASGRTQIPFQHARIGQRFYIRPRDARRNPGGSESPGGAQRRAEPRGVERGANFAVCNASSLGGVFRFAAFATLRDADDFRLNLSPRRGPTTIDSLDASRSAHVTNDAH